MGTVLNAFESVGQQQGRVDFAAVSRAALGSMDRIVGYYLPGGKVTGNEYVALNPTRADGRLGSFKVNLTTGVWADFASGEKGGDAIDLVANVRRLSKLDAARELSNLLAVPRAQGSTSLTGNVKAMPKRKPNVAATPNEASQQPTSFPPRTPPDAEGKPRFMSAGDEGPRVRDGEKRRHVYRRGGVPVRIKILRKGEEGAINVYRVTDATGSIGWQYRKPDGFQDVPFFVGDADPFAGDAAASIFWPEGEKDVETLAKVGLRAFTFGGVGDGLPSGCDAFIRGRAVVILADNDAAGRKHADEKAALALKVAASVRIVHFPDTPEKGDVSDWLPQHSVDELLQRVAEADELVRDETATADDSQGSPQNCGDATEATSEGPAQNCARPDETTDQQDDPPKASRQEAGKLPFGYSFHSDGLYWSDPADDEKPPMRLSGSFDVLAETRDGDGGNWGLLLSWADHDGRVHQLALPRSSLAGDGSEARRALLDGGLFISPSQKARQLFNGFLLQVKSPDRARATRRIGWHGTSFVMPDGCYGTANSDMHLLQSATAQEHAFRQSDTLQSWQDNVARYAAGNSRLVLAISAAFAGPLIQLCSAESGGVHFRGASSTGKSTALHVAGSVWGGGGVSGFIRSWRATSNGLEGVALSHCDSLLCLDELSQLAAREAGEAAYMLGNGSGKSRSARDGSARRPASWRLMFLSSGEISLADKIAEDGRGRKMAAGQQVRIVDIPADAGAGMGMFESIEGFASAEAMARYLREASQQHYGVAARAFLTALVPMIADAQKHVAGSVVEFCKQFVPAGADGQVERVAQRFGLIAASGELAIHLQILPWQQGEALIAAKICFEAWLAQRGGIEPSEVRAGIEQVRAFLLANGMARFIPAWEEEADKRIPIRDVAGFRQKATNDSGGWDYFVTSSAWKEVCAGLDPRRTATVLAGRGMIIAGEGSHLSKVVRVPGHGRLRLYHLPAAFLEGDENA